MKFDKINKLQDLIMTFHKVPENRKDNTAVEANLNWGASTFLANVILKAEPSHHLLTYKELLDIKASYESTKNQSVELDVYFQKYWLRNIFDFIKIPSAIRSIIYDYEKFQNNRNELAFLKTLHENYPEGKITQADYRKHLEEYNKSHNTVLDQTWIEEGKWISPVKEDTLKIDNINYFTVLIDNWDSFEFLNYLKSEIGNRSKNSVCLRKEDFLAIHESHSGCFARTPKLEDLISNELIIDDDDWIHLNFQGEAFRYFNTLGTEIYTNIWLGLLECSKLKDDSERVREFLNKTRSFEHWSFLNSNLPLDAKNRFSEAAMVVVLGADDLIGTDDELIKCLLDESLGTSGYAVKSNNYLQFEGLKFGDDFYDNYNELLLLSEEYQNNLFYDQESRSILSYLIHQIILFDRSFVTEENEMGETYTTHFPLVKKLLKNSSTRPYLLWTTCEVISRSRPEIIPYLIVEKEFASLSFRLLNQIKIQESVDIIENEFRLELQKQGLELTLNHLLQDPNLSTNLLVKVVFQIISEINREKFDPLIKNRSGITVEERKRQQRKREETLLSVIENCSEYGDLVRQHRLNFLMPKIWEGLLEFFTSFSENNKFNKNFLRLPLYNIDRMAWLARCLFFPKYEFEKNDLIKFQNLLADSFCQLYVETFSVQYIDKIDPGNGKLIKALPSWSETNDRIDRINWLYLVYVLFVTDNLSSFLNVKIKFEIVEDEFHEINRFNARKLRTHVYILLKVLKEINEYNDIILLPKEDLYIVKKEIESRLVKIIKLYGSEGTPSKINIISETFDRLILRDEKDELLPQLVKISNSFSNHNSLINALLNTSNLTQLLIVLDESESEYGRKQAIDKIHKIDIKRSIYNVNFGSELIYILSKIVLFPDLVDQAKVVIDYWEGVGNRKRLDRATEYKIYESKLIYALQKKDLQYLDSVEEPKAHFKSINEFKPIDHKQFIRALIYLEDNPKDSYFTFDALHSKYRNDITIALNRFATKLNFAIKEGNSDLIRSCLTEWAELEVSLDATSLIKIKDKVIYNKLVAYQNLNEDLLFEEEFEKLEPHKQMSISILELRLEHLLKIEDKKGAEHLFNQAKEYHNSQKLDKSHVINQLLKKISSTMQPGELRNAYHALSNVDVETLLHAIQFPTSKNDLGLFLSSMIAESSDNMLLKIKSIESVKSEDPYTDFLITTLNARLNHLGFNISGQSRGGHSATGKSSGERDMTINRLGVELAVYEAFIYRDVTTVQTHLTKLLNYSHKRRHLFMIGYDLKQGSKFDKRWENYFDEVIPNLNYTEGYEPKLENSSDITIELGYDASGIRIAEMHHGKSTKIYHIMINLNYKV